MIRNRDPHTMSSSPGLPADPPMPDVLKLAVTADKADLHEFFGDGLPSTNIVCGYLACEARPFNPLMESLPPLIKAGDPTRVPRSRRHLRPIPDALSSNADAGSFR